MINHHISERLQRELLITKAVQFLTLRGGGLPLQGGLMLQKQKLWGRRYAVLRGQFCWAPMWPHAGSHPFGGNLSRQMPRLSQFSKTQLSKYSVKQMKMTWSHHVVCSSLLYLGGKSCSELSHDSWHRTAPCFQISLFTARVKKKIIKSQASNIFYYR